MDSEIGWRVTNIETVERWASAAAASALIGYGLRRRTAAGLCVAAAATPFVFRAWTGEWPRVNNGVSGHDDNRVALARDRGVHVRESIRLEKPLDEVYRCWRRLENLSRFMSHHIEQSHHGRGADVRARRQHR